MRSGTAKRWLGRGLALARILPVGFVLVGFAIGGDADAQQGQPASTTIARSGYPRVLPDLRVAFQLEAPEADSVQIRLGGDTYDLTKSNDGVWTCTTAPQDPGFHYYSLVINGVSVADPASRSYYGTGRDASAIEIPEAGAGFYIVRDVPHGTVRLERYRSDVTGEWSTLYVYTPPGYDDDPDARYPVIYIQHGGGEDQTGWVRQGRTDVILDNLIADGRARPMLVVSASGNAPASRGAGGYNDEAMAVFAEHLFADVVPVVERRYRASTDPRDRAIAGLSMGGGQAFYTGLRHPERFGAVGVFSTGLFRGTGGPFDPEATIPGILTDPERFNRQLDLFYISVGEQDQRLESTRDLVETFRDNGLDVVFSTFPGDHEWQVWRKSLHDFAQRVFR